MKILAAALCLALSVQAMAQNTTAPSNQAPVAVQKKNNPKNPEQRAVRILRQMSSKIQLSEAQSTQVKQILIEREEARDAALKAAGGDVQKARPEIKASREKAEQKLKSVLSPEQYKAWQDYREELKRQKQEKMKQENPKGGSEKIQEEDFY